MTTSNGPEPTPSNEHEPAPGKQHVTAPLDRDVSVRVRSLLTVAGLPADERQIAGFVAAYVAQRPAIDGLFDVPEARYAHPVLERRVPVQRDGFGEVSA